MTPLLYDFEKGDIASTDSERSAEKISKLLIDCSAALVVPLVKTIKRKTNVMFMSDSLMMLKQLVLTVRLPLSPGGKAIILMETKFSKITVQNVESIVSNHVIFSIDLKPKKSPNFATQHIPMRSCFGGS